MLWLLSVTGCIPGQRGRFGLWGDVCYWEHWSCLLPWMGYGLKEEGSGRLLRDIMVRLSECKARAGHGPWVGTWAAASP